MRALVFFLIALLAISPRVLADTETRDCTVTADPGSVWTNDANILSGTDSSAFAYHTTTGTNALQITTCGFANVSGTINSITVRTIGRGSGSSAARRAIAVNLLGLGTCSELTGINQNASWTTNDNTQSNNWSCTSVSADAIKATTFGAQVRHNASGAYQIDEEYMNITVDYTPTTTSTSTSTTSTSTSTTTTLLYTYQDGAGGCGNANCGANVPDNHMYAGLNTYNYGASTWVRVGNGAGGAYRGLIEFDVSDIGPASTITTATLDLYDQTHSGTPGVGKFCRLRRADWEEGTLNGAAGAASWNEYKPSTTWTTAGAGDTTNDIESPGSGDTTCVAYSAPTLNSHNVTTITGLVRDAIQNRGGKLRLRMAQDTESGTVYADYSSSSNATQAQRPLLSVGISDLQPPVTRRAQRRYMF